MSSRRQRLWFAGKCAIAAYLLLMTFGGCADKLVLAPSTDHRDSGGAARKTIPFQDGVLEIWTARSKACADRPPEAFLLEFCGNGTRAENIASYVAHRWDKYRVEVWAVNYPGFGGSTGPAKLKSVAPASLGAYDSLVAVAKSQPIFAGGHSFGTAAAMYVAAHRKTAGMFLHNPPALRELLIGHFGWWNLWLAAFPISLQIPAELDSRANAAQVHVSAVFVSALKDDFVPAKYHRMVIDAYAGPEHVIELKNGDHNSPVDEESAAVDKALQWLWENRAP